MLKFITVFEFLTILSILSILSAIRSHLYVAVILNRVLY